MANDYRDRAVDAMNAGREEVTNAMQNAADRVESAADRFEEKAQAIPGGEAVSDFARTGAGKVKAAAKYVREHDVNDMAEDVTTLVKAHPLPAILGAAVIGFLAGRVVRSS